MAGRDHRVALTALPARSDQMKGQVMSSKIEDWFNVPQIEEELQVELGAIRVHATIERDFNGALFYTVTHYTVTSKSNPKGVTFKCSTYRTTPFDVLVDAWAMDYWTPERMSEITLHHDGVLAHYKKQAFEQRQDNREYQEAVL